MPSASGPFPGELDKESASAGMAVIVDIAVTAGAANFLPVRLRYR
jgi:hypothetical protein